MAYMGSDLPYCGAPPVPAELWHNWNLDPVLITALLAVAFAYEAGRRRSSNRLDLSPGYRTAVFFYAGWLVASLALISPLCSLSVALFSARVGQHMVLALIAAPLVVLGRPDLLLVSVVPKTTGWLWIYGAVRLLTGAQVAASLFAIFLWLWHAPDLYAVTFSSDTAYWTMHITLFGSALLLWNVLLSADTAGKLRGVMLGFGTSMHMGLLGALITLAPRTVYEVHTATTLPWGLTALQDQQLGGLIMWIPGGSLFFLAGLLTFHNLLRTLDATAKTKPATAKG